MSLSTHSLTRNTYGHEFPPSTPRGACSGEMIPLGIGTTVELLSLLFDKEVSEKFGKRWLAKTAGEVEGKTRWMYLSINDIGVPLTTVST